MVMTSMALAVLYWHGICGIVYDYTFTATMAINVVSRTTKVPAFIALRGAMHCPDKKREGLCSWTRVSAQLRASFCGKV